MSQRTPLGIHHQFQKQMNRLPRAISSVLQQCPRSAQAGAGGAEPNSCTAGGYLRKSVFPCAFHTVAVVYD